MDIRSFFQSNKAKDGKTDERPASAKASGLSTASKENSSDLEEVLRPNPQLSLHKENKRLRPSQAEYDRVYDKKRCRRVLSSWTETYPWLRTNQSQTVMWCGVCRKQPKCADTSSNFFCENGVSGDALRLAAVKAHDSSRKHKDCVSADMAIEKPNSTPLAKCLFRLSEDQTRVMTVLFNTAYHCAKQELSFTKFASLCDLQERNGLSFGSNYRTDMQARHFVRHISAVEEGILKDKISKSRFISIMADGSTDVSVKEEEIVYVRSVQEGKPVTNFVSMVEAESSDAKGVLKAINQGLEIIGESCSSKKLVCLNLDGASVNMGHKSGVGALVKIDIPHLLVIHCVAHKLELTIMDSMKLSNYLKPSGKFYETVNGLLKMYQYSPKLRRQLKEVASFLDTVPAEMGMVQQIRWVASQQRALKALEKNWTSIIVHLEEIGSGKNEQAAKSRGFLKEIKSVKFLQHLYQVLDILEILAPLSKLFQSDETLFVDLMNHIEVALQKFQELLKKAGVHYQGFKKMCSEKIFKEVVLSGNPATDDSELKNIVQHVVDALSKRFRQIEEKPLSLFQVLDFTYWPLDPKDLASFGIEEVSELVNIYATLFSDEEIVSIKEEWLQFKLVVLRLRKNSKDKSKLAVYGYLLRNPLAEIKCFLILIELMICVSPSTSACERGFSTMNRLKTSTRNCLSNSTMNDLLRVSVDGPPENEFNPSEAIWHWHTHTKGTRHVQGHALTTSCTNEESVGGFCL